MTPGPYSLWIYRGDTYQWLFQMWHDDHRRFPVNLLGAQVKAEIRDEEGGRLRARIECYTFLPNSIIATLSARESEQLTQERGVWDLQITQIDKVSTILRGPVVVMADVTDSRRYDTDAPNAAVSTTTLMPFPKRGVRAA